jgi:signal transduction histidine kinase
MPRFEPRGVPLVLAANACEGSFFVDAGLLKAALVNIIENALDACVTDQRSGRQHRVTLTVACTAEDIALTVEDNGTGMTESQIKKLFTVFYSTKGVKGTGLGLFIAETIIKQHGGDIAVSSTLGQGSRFCIQLPRSSPKNPS